MSELKTFMSIIRALVQNAATGPPDDFTLGLIILMIIETPVIILLTVTFITNRKRPKITAVFIGALTTMLGGFIAATIGLGFILGHFF